jgi:hypothetical protein
MTEPKHKYRWAKTPKMRAFIDNIVDALREQDNAKQGVYSCDNEPPGSDEAFIPYCAECGRIPTEGEINMDNDLCLPCETRISLGMVQGERKPAFEG